MTQAKPLIKVEDGDELANQAEIATETPVSNSRKG